MKKPIISARKSATYTAPSKTRIERLNDEFLWQYPQVKFMSKEKIQKYFSMFTLDLLKEEKEAKSYYFLR